MSLLNHGYQPTSTECPDCEEGNLWVNSFELTCDECHIVIRKGESDYFEKESAFENFRKNRSDNRYENSGRMIQIGGFKFAYYGPGIYGTGEQKE